MTPLPDLALLRELLDYDFETGCLRWRHRPEEMFSSRWHQRKWNSRYAGTEALANIDSEGYPSGKLCKRKVRAHRVIWKWVTGEDAIVVDHVNGARADNRWSNLRSTDCVGNARNSAKPRSNTSGRVGVSFNKQQGKWVAYIRDGGRPRHIGSFPTAVEASAARATAERALGYHQNHGRAA